MSRNDEMILDQLEKESTPSNITNQLSSPISLNNTQKLSLDEDKILSIPRYQSSAIDRYYINDYNISSYPTANFQKTVPDTNKLPLSKKMNIIIENKSTTSRIGNNSMRGDYDEDSPVPVYKRV